MIDHHETSGGDKLTALLNKITQTMGVTAMQPDVSLDVTESAPESESALGIAAFYSGMSIAVSSARQEITDRLADANDKWKAGWVDIERVWEADALANTINELPGVEVLQSADHIGNSNTRCAHYVFGERLGEGWAMPEEELHDDIWDNTTEFLRSYGYEPVDQPAPGDIAVYSFEEPRGKGLEWAEHFALMEADGRAVSRFGPGPVARHDLSAVPVSYGTHVFFFRKSEEL